MICVWDLLFLLNETNLLTNVHPVIDRRQTHTHTARGKEIGGNFTAIGVNNILLYRYIKYSASVLLINYSFPQALLLKSLNFKSGISIIYVIMGHTGRILGYTFSFYHSNSSVDGSLGVINQ